MSQYRQETVLSADGYRLSVRIYEADQPRAVIRVIHGMEEYQNRYEPFALWMRDQGYTLVTADLRGHGPDAPLLSHIADRDGDRLLLQDEEVLLEKARSVCPGKPVFLLGHSMGTIIARRLLQTRSQDFAGVILSGYPNPQKAAAMGVRIASLLSAMKGPRAHSRLLDGMVLGGFSRAVKDAPSPLAWLSFREENWQAYAADPLCGAPFTIGSYQTLFCLLRDIARPQLVQHPAPHLPMLLISGAEDPCTGGEAGRAESLRVLKESGFDRLRVETLPRMRHEILNEADRERVYRSMLSFLESL